MNTEQEIIADKELRRDLDAQLQKLKSLPPSRERSLARTNLEQSIMWLGMDLKRINEEHIATLPSPYLCGSCNAETPYPLVSKVCPSCGGDVGANCGPLDNPAFKASKQPIADPYPNSKDPSNTKIEPTADGLKL